ncbi:MAG: protease modulator HflC [Oscillospiraceae bacterium]|nr:protease modulator HflC [Oscillospiraceae bacterium]
MKTKNKVGITILAVAIIAGIIALMSFYTVNENEYACVVRFSKIIKVASESGIYFKAPFLDEVSIYPKTVILYDIKPSEVLTSDKKSMIVDSYILWKITDPILFYKTLQTTNEAEVRIDNTTFNALKTTMGNIEQNSVINQENAGERNELYKKINDQVAESAKQYGIEIVDVKIKRLDLPNENEAAVFTRMISERNQMAAKYTADGEKQATMIKNDVDKKVNITISNAEAEAARIEAEGENEYMKILAAAYDTDDKKSFYTFLRSIEALKATLNGENKTVIFDADSELATVLKGYIK